MRTYLALAGFESVHQRRNGSLVIQVAEEHQLFVDKIAVVDLLRVLLVEVQFSQAQLSAAFALVHPRRQPLFALLHVFLTERHRDGVIILVAVVTERDPVTLHVREVAFRFLRRRRSQT